ncbi:CinA family protein [Candidatus Endowatersipora endosymbiont of Watersipora subatra]|uniref:CinA family protein n=1 Tax=Candidatus Endowatersipora endosymbiont of Watersipora subatra TaxID=3077946 RepID=UPI00312C92BE
MMTDHSLESRVSTLAENVIVKSRREGLKVTTAESCTGGMISAGLTSIVGSSYVLDRGFVTYSDISKFEMLGVSMKYIHDQGPVSAIVACEMVKGALKNSRGDIAVAVTGIAGPGGEENDQSMGLVFISSARREETPTVQEYHFAEKVKEATRADIRYLTTIKALNHLLARINLFQGTVP